MDLKFDGVDSMRRLAEEFPKAAASALNKTMAQVRTRAIREIAAKYRIKQEDIKAKMGPTEKATPSSLKTWFVTGGRRISLAYFGAKQFTKGVRVRIRKDGQPQFVKGMFMATMGKSGHKGGFIRKGKKRLPIREWTGPTVAQMLRGVDEKLKAFAMEKLPEVLKHEIEWRLKKGK